MKITREVKERFFEKINKNKNGCWEWTAATSTKGYGRFKINGRLYLAHRISFIIHKGSLGKSLACHSCDNPKCVNPSHLFKGTQSTNMIDCFKKGRLYVASGLPKGHKFSAIISDNKIINIKTAIEKGVKLTLIARRFKVKYQTIRDISSGRSYYNVKLPV